MYLSQQKPSALDLTASPAVTRFLVEPASPFDLLMTADGSFEVTIEEVSDDEEFMPAPVAPGLKPAANFKAAIPVNIAPAEPVKPPTAKNSPAPIAVAAPLSKPAPKPTDLADLLAQISATREQSDPKAYARFVTTSRKAATPQAPAGEGSYEDLVSLLTDSRDMSRAAEAIQVQLEPEIASIKEPDPESTGVAPYFDWWRR